MVSSNNPFLQMFARSPFKPMQEHIAKAQECAIELVPFFEAVMADDWDKAKIIQQKIAVLEGDADAMKKEIRQNLPKSIFLPVPRTDLLEVLRMQDKIANRAKDISGVMLGRKMSVPGIIQSDMTEYVRVALATSEQALTALNELDELVNSGFGGHEINVIEKMIDKLDALEGRINVFGSSSQASARVETTNKNLPEVMAILNDIFKRHEQLPALAMQIELILWCI